MTQNEKYLVAGVAALLTFVLVILWVSPALEAASSAQPMVQAMVVIGATTTVAVAMVAVGLLIIW